MEREGKFSVVDEPETKPVPIEERFPDAKVLWSLDGRTGGNASTCQEAGYAVRTGSDNTIVCVDRIKWPSGCQVVLILGRSGSGKSKLLQNMCPTADSSLTDEDHHWPPNLSILDGLGIDATRWLGAVGLGSIPVWCQPYAALSTGEAFRAQLARRLQKAWKRGIPLAIDNFCDHLDPLSASCCAASLARYLRSDGGRATQAVLASCHERVAHFLQPDAVVVCRVGHPPAVLRNNGTGSPPSLQITVHQQSKATAATDDGVARGGEVVLAWLQRCGLSIRHSQCFALPSCSAEGCTTLSGGHVLASRVEPTDAIRACDRLFDHPHDGVCARQLPPFPPADFLATQGGRNGAPPDESWSGFRLGLICGQSGACKSALLVLHFGVPRAVSWSKERKLGEVFASASQAIRCLRAAALGNDALEWQKLCCSAGELAQAHLALTLAAAEPFNSEAISHYALYDEFGSAWDEEKSCQIGQALSAALRTTDTTWRLRCRGVVLAGCHVAVVGPRALWPDWVFEASSATCFLFDQPRIGIDVDSGTQTKDAELDFDLHGSKDEHPIKEGAGLKLWETLAQHAITESSQAIRILSPCLDLTLSRCDASAWTRFRSHHYKSSELSKVATSFLLEAAIDLGLGEGVRVPVGFVATIPHSGRRTAGSTAPPQRAHRTVVLPEFQGLGIGSRLSDAAAEWHYRNGSDYYGQTAHPRFGAYRDNSPLWTPTEANHTQPQLRWLPRRLTGATQSSVALRQRHPKFVYAHRYIGCGRQPLLDVHGTTLAEDQVAARASFLASRVRFMSD